MGKLLHRWQQKWVERWERIYSQPPTGWSQAPQVLTNAPPARRRNHVWVDGWSGGMGGWVVWVMGLRNLRSLRDIFLRANFLRCDYEAK